MDETSLTLLERLQRNPDPESWQRIVDIYSPLIARWLARASLQYVDHQDIVQEVLSVVVKKLPEFQRRRKDRFAWLRAITVNCLRSHWRSTKHRVLSGGRDDIQQKLQEMEDPTSALAREWDAEHDRHVVRRLLELMEPHFEPKTLSAFRRVVVEGQKPTQVASELGISVNAVFLGKSKILRRLRRELAGIVPEKAIGGQV